MSFLRFSVLRYVEGQTNDYVFECGGSRGRGKIGGKNFIQDYGSLSDKGLVELLCRAIEGDFSKNRLMQEYLRKKIAERLGVKLRKKTLSYEEETERTFKELGKK